MNDTTRAKFLGVLPASIVAAALIVSATIVTHGPAISGTNVAYGSPAVVHTRLAPPIAYESARRQLREQLLAAPGVHTYQQGKITYTLTDINVRQVIYSSKDDTFTLLFQWVWSPSMSAAGPRSDYITLSNDGYGHYYGTVFADRNSASQDHTADISIQ